MLSRNKGEKKSLRNKEVYQTLFFTLEKELAEIARIERNATVVPAESIDTPYMESTAAATKRNNPAIAEGWGNIFIAPIQRLRNVKRMRDKRETIKNAPIAPLSASTFQ
jgi:hypothetical protein